MNLNDLLESKGIDPAKVIVMRHRPHERELAKILPWFAAERPETFNAYQQTQGDKVERAMKRLEADGYVASFIGHAPGQALFVGLYTIDASKPLTREQFWAVPAYQEMKMFGLQGFTEQDPRALILWFDMTPTDFYAHWKGRLVVAWPPPERSWWRRSHKNDMAVLAIHEESILDAAMPAWDQLDVSWDQNSQTR